MFLQRSKCSLKVLVSRLSSHLAGYERWRLTLFFLGSFQREERNLVNTESDETHACPDAHGPLPYHTEILSTQQHWYQSANRAVRTSSSLGTNTILGIFFSWCTPGWLWVGQREGKATDSLSFPLHILERDYGYMVHEFIQQKYVGLIFLLKPLQEATQWYLL